MSNSERLSAPKIIQKLASLLLRQGSLEVDSGDNEALLNSQKLQSELIEQFKLWGGKDAVEAWLKENDPYFSVPSDFDQIDWSFLNNSETQ